MNIKDYAEMILKPESIVVDKTPAVMDRIHKMAREIHEKPVQNRGRELEQVVSDVRNVVLEHAITLNNNSFSLNPLTHDKTNPHSYAYDLICNIDNKTFEVKRWPPDDNNGRTATWFSYPTKSLETLLKNLSIVDYVVGAKLIDHGDFFEVGYHMIADAKSFTKYLHKSHYHNWQSVYYHTHAVPAGKCIMNPNVKYRKVSCSDTRLQFSKSA